MKCPIDQATLVIADRQGIEIDYCPECRGVWLDRGELDKLIERSTLAVHTNSKDEPHFSERHEHNERQQYERHHYNEDDYRGHHDGKRHKKESFLGDLFDF